MKDFVLDMHDIFLLCCEYAFFPYLDDFLAKAVGKAEAWSDMQKIE